MLDSGTRGTFHSTQSSGNFRTQWYLILTGTFLEKGLTLIGNWSSWSDRWIESASGLKIVACFVLVCSGLEEQLQQAKQHAEQFKSMSEANETALSDLNKVILYS